MWCLVLRSLVFQGVCLFAFADPLVKAVDEHAGPNSTSSHLLRPGDVLDIRVYEHPELELKVRVDSDGTIRFPLCGLQEVTGKTAGEVASLLEKGLSEAAIIERAQVFVFVDQYSPRRVYVLGEVNGTNSLAIEIPPELQLSALQAVSHAGGFSEKADLRAVFVLRTLAGGSVSRIPVDVHGIMGREAEASDVLLQPGDTLMIPVAKPVLVLGKVNKPGSFYIDTGHSVSIPEVVSRAGGFGELADLRRVVLVRSNEEGEKRRILVDLRETPEIPECWGGISVEPGDAVFVPEAKSVSVLGAVKQPGAFAVNTSQDVSALEMISRGGGFEDGAARDRVTILRTGVDGERRAIRVVVGGARETAGEAPTKAALVQPGDVVLAVAQQRLFVLGQVNEAGAFDMERNHPLRVTQAIAMAGGFSQLAAQNAVLLIRDDQVQRLDLQKTLRADGDLAVDVELEPGDVIFVTESRW